MGRRGAGLPALSRASWTRDRTVLNALFRFACGNKRGLDDHLHHLKIRCWGVAALALPAGASDRSSTLPKPGQFVMPTYGYARVSTEGPGLEPQRVALQAAGCDAIIEEKASGTDRTRPELAHLLGRLRRGDTLVVVRSDRLARALAFACQARAVARRRRALPRALRPDRHRQSHRQAGCPSVVVQVIGAIAEVERNLIAERTKSGLAVAKARGRKCGKPRFARQATPRPGVAWRRGRRGRVWRRCCLASMLGRPPSGGCGRRHAGRT
jgi:DNA invertase Pin-like site-specific DNA recombinase